MLIFWSNNKKILKFFLLLDKFILFCAIYIRSIKSIVYLPYLLVFYFSSLFILLLSRAKSALSRGSAGHFRASTSGRERPSRLFQRRRSSERRFRSSQVSHVRSWTSRKGFDWVLELFNYLLVGQVKVDKVYVLDLIILKK